METEVLTYRSLSEELERVCEFLSNEAFRYEGRLKWECNVDPMAETGMPVPKMLIQIFVERAIRYGIFNSGEGGKIEVSVHRTSVGTLVMVTDNGIIPDPAIQPDRMKGNRLELLDSQIEVFNREHDHAVSYRVLQIAHSEPEMTGTRVLVTISS